MVVPTLEHASPTDPEAMALIKELNTYLDGLYSPDANHFSLEADEVTGSSGVFLLARIEGRPVGCGAVRMIGDTEAEVKRMYVRPEARGKGVGAVILARLEDEARSRGARRMLLEMGADQPEAQALYRRFGFRPVPCWGEYLRTIETSVCLGKDL